MSMKANRSYRCSRISVVGLLMLSVSCCVLALFYIYYSADFVQQTSNVLFLQEEIQATNGAAVDYATCCRYPDLLLDICGRLSCTSTCPHRHQQPYLIQKLEENAAERGRNSHLLSNQNNDRAFFLETSGRDHLGFRQACAVESLAFVNPDLTVYVLFMGGNVNSSAVTLRTLRDKYGNIRLIGVNLDDYVTGTPLERWYRCNNWRRGKYHVSHLSDGLRFLTLAKYGGYYFDLDMIAVRPVTRYRNFVAAESDYEFGSGAIHCDHKHPLMELALKDFVDNYRSDKWGHNGPALLMRVLKNWCKVGDMESMNRVRCRGFSALPKSLFCPVHFDEVDEFFDHRKINESSSKPGWLTDQVVGVHTWNKLSYDKPIYKNSTQYYTWLAKTHCPHTFSIAPDVF